MALFPVPGDGNCMIWSLRVHLLGLDHCSKATPGQAKREQRSLRQTLKMAWYGVSNNATWTTLFDSLYKDEFPELREPEVATPQKNSKKRLFDDCEDLVTPPRVEPHPQKKGSLPHVGEAKGVPSMQPGRLDPEPTLKLPGPTKKAAVLEPPIPNLEEVAHDALMRGQELPVVPVAQPDPDGDAEQDPLVLKDDDPMMNRKRKVHSRCVKRLPSERESKLRSIAFLLAQKGLSYTEFWTNHRKRAVLTKAATCADGGFKQMKCRLLDQKEPECEHCLAMFADFGLKVEDFEDVRLPELPKVSEAGEAAELGVGEQDREVAEEASELEGTEYDRCVAYVKSFGPVIELVEHPKFGYTCRACCSVKHPMGRTNTLVKPTMDTVKRFLGQHLICSKHITKAKLWEEKQNAKERPAEDSGKCPGYTIAEGKGPGLLHSFTEEFQLWATHAKVSSTKVQHSYWWNLSTNSWHMRHVSCTEVIDKKNQHDLCTKCSQLGDPKGPLRRVLRFAAKYWASLLLNKKLFSSPEEASRFEEQVSQTAFGKRSDLWRKVKGLSLPELQQWVRKSMMTVPVAEFTPNMELFHASVVVPCMKVNVACINNRMQVLFAQFANSVSGNHLTET